MNFLLSYNENNYLYSWKGAVHVNLDVILQNLSKCTRYSLLDEVSNYLFYIDDDVFYVAPSFNEIKIAYGEVALLGYARLWATGSL